MAPPSSCWVTFSPVTVFTTSGPVMNMYDVSSTMNTKSVMAGRVDGAAGARPHDHADLGDDARRLHVAVEDAAVAVEADHALLDAGAGAVVDADDRGPDLERQVHELVDLVGEHLAERAAEHREVLREHEDLAAVDRAPAADDAVGVGPVVEARLGRAAGQQVELVERPRIEQQVDALAGQQLAPVVLALPRPVGAGSDGLFLALGQVGEPVAHRVVHHAATVPALLWASEILRRRDGPRLERGRRYPDQGSLRGRPRSCGGTVVGDWIDTMGQLFHIYRRVASVEGKTAGLARRHRPAARLRQWLRAG